MNRLFRSCVAGSCLAIASLGVSAVLLPAPYASAQEFPDPDDFVDPVTGEFDLEAYLAALNAGQDDGETDGEVVDADGTADGEELSQSGVLPRTGSDVDAVVAAGLGLVAVGGVVTFASRRRRDLDTASTG